MVISIDCETTKKPNFLPWLPRSYLVSLSIARSDGVVKSWLFNHPEATKTQRECIDEIQEDVSKATRIVAHNLKFDLHWLRSLGLDCSSNLLYCTQVAEYVITGQQKQDGLSLNDLAVKYGLPTKLDKVKTFWDSGYDTDEVPAHILNEYCELDAQLALQIHNLQIPQIKELGLEALVSLEMEVLRCFEDMEYNGMKLDREKLETYGKEYTERLEELDRELRESLGIENVSSGDQLSCGLYGGTYSVDGRVPGKRPGTTKKGKVPHTIQGAGFSSIAGTETAKAGFYQTSIDVLTQLKARTKEQKRIKELLLERSRLDQLNKTYFKGLLERILEDDTVHPTVNMTVTTTGRTSCSNPNLQNQPRSNTGSVKVCFISRF